MYSHARHKHDGPLQHLVSTTDRLTAARGYPKGVISKVAKADFVALATSEREEEEPHSNRKVGTFVEVQVFATAVDIVR